MKFHLTRTYFAFAFLAIVFLFIALGYLNFFPK